VVLPSNVGQIFRKTGRTVAKDGGTVRVPWEEEDYRSEVAWEIVKG